MNMSRTPFKFIFAILTLTFVVNAQANWWKFGGDDESGTPGGSLAEIEWDDLIPDDFVQPENPFVTMPQEQIDKLMDGSPESNAKMAKLEEAFNYAPVVPELDGRRVKFPAYITPLEFNGESKIKEFLLVPYVGACMHVPPPPANQIVHAKSPKAINFKSMYDPVWAIGVIRTESVKTQLAETGYRLEVEAVLPYNSK